jgi:hypothetical protein
LALKLIGKAKNGEFLNKISELKTMYCYLNLIDGQEEIFSILDLLSNVDYAPVSKDKQL